MKAAISLCAVLVAAILGLGDGASLADNRGSQRGKMDRHRIYHASRIRQQLAQSVNAIDLHSLLLPYS